MAYTEIDDSGLFFNIKLYTGNSGTQTLTGVGFQPNLTWIKQRSDNTDNTLYDSVRGATYRIRSNSTATEATDVGLTAWNSDGFNIGNHDSTNLNNGTYVGWNWKAETAFSNDASATSVGSIDSAGSVNTTAGFSIITYTGTGSNATVAHGLGAVPNVIIVKGRNTAEGWIVYHGANTSAPATDYLRLDTSGATVDAADIWNDTSPTSSVFSIGDSGKVNDTKNYVAYCFAEKQGYSKFGSYKGNANADGTFVYLGFKPAYVIVKQTNTGDEPWIIKDNKREPRNINTGIDSATLFASVNSAESNRDAMSFLSNGFKCRDNGAPINSGSYIYLAFAEQPFVTSKGIPATAR